MRSDREKLLDILESIVRIEKYAQQGKTVFDQDELIQTWTAYHLQVIGEAARALSTALKQKYDRVPWTKIVDLRNLLVHEYFRIDVEIVWSIVESDLPDLKQNIAVILEELGEES